MNRLPRITSKQKEGVRKLLEWCVSMYQQANGVNGKRMWHNRKEFLAKLQKQQSYTDEDKVLYNGIRNAYLKEKFLK